MHFETVFETIRNYREIENNVSKTCVLTLFETICNCRENFENSVSKACILMVLEIIWNCSKKINENKDVKLYILTVFDTI